MFKTFAAVLVVLTVVSGVAVGLSPAMRAAARQQWTERFGWTEAFPKCPQPAVTAKSPPAASSCPPPARLDKSWASDLVW